MDGDKCGHPTPTGPCGNPKAKNDEGIVIGKCRQEHFGKPDPLPAALFGAGRRTETDLDLVDDFVELDEPADPFAGRALRRAVVNVKERRDGEVVARYLPSNYRVVGWLAGQRGRVLVIEGYDHAGWTFEDYVAPRLASGLYFAREVLAPETSSDELLWVSSLYTPSEIDGEQALDDLLDLLAADNATAELPGGHVATVVAESDGISGGFLSMQINPHYRWTVRHADSDEPLELPSGERGEGTDKDTGPARAVVEAFARAAGLLPRRAGLEFESVERPNDPRRVVSEAIIGTGEDRLRVEVRHRSEGDFAWTVFGIGDHGEEEDIASGEAPLRFLAEDEACGAVADDVLLSV